MVATLEGSLSEPMTSADEEEEDGNSVDSEVSALRRAVTTTSTLVSGMSASEAPDWMWNYNLMAILVGVNHGVEDLFFAYTTVVYPGKVGYNANTLVYSVWCFSSMLLATPVLMKLGSKTVIVLGLVFYDIQYIMFVICSFLDDSWLLEAVAYTGAIACGIGAGFLWTAEGVYFAQSTQRVADATGEPLKAKSAQLAALFGLWSLGIETAVKVSSYALETMGCSMAISFSGALVLALGATLLFQLCTRPVHYEHHKLSGHTQGQCETTLGAIALWPDARIWLISFTTVAFTVGGAFINGVVGTDYVSKQLGSKYIALFSAVIALVGALVQAPLRALAQRLGKGAVLGVGTIALCSMPLLYVTLDASTMGWWLILYYVLHGTVRGIQAGVNNAVYADQFPEPKTESAFANMCMQGGLTSSIAFFFAARVPHKDLMKIMVGAACCIVPGYLAACHMKSGHLSHSSAESSDERPGAE